MAKKIFAKVLDLEESHCKRRAERVTPREERQWRHMISLLQSALFFRQISGAPHNSAAADKTGGDIGVKRERRQRQAQAVNQ